jgi:cobaltochelatase CobN
MLQTVKKLKNYYLGGISLAVRNLDGSSPEMFNSNLRNPKQEKMESLNTFMSKELRTRYFHPRWIEEMQKKGYSGTLNIVDTVNNFWGWQVVDPQNIRADQWQEFFEVYVNDKYEMQMQEWFESNNAEAFCGG